MKKTTIFIFVIISLILIGVLIYSINEFIDYKSNQVKTEFITKVKDVDKYTKKASEDEDSIATSVATTIYILQTL